MKNKHKNKTFLILWYNTLKSTVWQLNNCHTRAGIKWTGKSYYLEEGEEEEDGRAEESSAIDAGQAAISISSNADGTHVHIFESSQPKYLDVGDL